jgi:hypothetical protein
MLFEKRWMYKEGPEISSIAIDILSLQQQHNHLPYRFVVKKVSVDSSGLYSDNSPSEIV